MPETFSLEELSCRINEWCEDHGIAPANGQAGESVSERTIRNWVHAGKLSAEKSDGTFRIARDQLEAFRRFVVAMGTRDLADWTKCIPTYVRLDLEDDRVAGAELVEYQGETNI